MQLASPDLRYRDSFLAAVREYQAEDSPYRRDIYELDLEELTANFGEYVDRLRAQERGEQLPPGYVPQTTYWLVDGDQVFGRVAIRHRLTEWLAREGGHIGYDIRPSQRRRGYGKLILRLALPKAALLGLSEVMVSCDETNPASQRIIEANGGVLAEAYAGQPDRPRKLRYWITLAGQPGHS